MEGAADGTWLLLCLHWTQKKKAHHSGTFWRQDVKKNVDKVTEKENKIENGANEWNLTFTGLTFNMTAPGQYVFPYWP